MCRTVKWARQTKPNDLDKVRPPLGPVGWPRQWADQNELGEKSLGLKVKILDSLVHERQTQQLRL